MKRSVYIVGIILAVWFLASGNYQGAAAQTMAEATFAVS